jgi:hypothetical protein
MTSADVDARAAAERLATKHNAALASLEAPFATAPAKLRPLPPHYGGNGTWKAQPWNLRNVAKDYERIALGAAFCPP